MTLDKKYAILLKEKRALEQKYNDLALQYNNYKSTTEYGFQRAKELITELQGFKQEYAKRLAELKEKTEQTKELNRTLKMAVKEATASIQKKRR